MTKQRRSLLLLAVSTAFITVGLVLPGLTGAGSLEPPSSAVDGFGNPVPTMKSLDQVKPQIPISSLPYTITDSGSYYLTGDLTTTDSGILVNADNVTIDLMGYSLIGPGSGANTAIYMDGRSNVEIRNGTVRDFGNSGIIENDPSNGRQHRIIGVRAVSNGGAGIELFGEGHLVKNCSATGNGYFGIQVWKGCTAIGNIVFKNRSTGIYAESGCTITGNTVYDNQSGGIGAFSGNTITGNTVHDNEDVGIFASVACTVTGNTVYDNQSSGIFAFQDGMVTGNTIGSNNKSDGSLGAGISVSYNCLVKNNMVALNKQNNIFVAGFRNTIEQNFVTGSTNGIYFYQQNNFYSNNRACANTTPYANTTGNTDGGGNITF